MQGITNAITSSENLELYYTKGETDTLLAGKANVATTLAGYGITDGANTALSNLSASGQMIIDSANGTISNCILEIPQNLKLELSNNVLTLKAGSVLTLGGDTYATMTTTSDTVSSSSWLANTRYIIFRLRSGNFYRTAINNVKSGDSEHIDTSSSVIYYNTDNKMTYLSGNINTDLSVYPLCLIDVDSNGIASFAKDSNGNDMIFNGVGFIGHHAFVYPNVEWLVANGINTDGTLRSTIVKNSAFQIIQLYNYHNAIFGYTSTAVTARTDIGEYASYDELPTSNLPMNSIAYLKDENVMCYLQSGVWTRFHGRYVNIIDFNYNGTTVTDFTIRQPYEGARYLLTDDLYKQIGDIETLLATV